MGELKFTDEAETELRGLLAPYGGPFNGADLQGERFTPQTDFALDWFDVRPLLFHHGLDDTTQTAVVGRIKALERDDLGLWMQAQLDAHSRYYESIRELVKQGKLGLSSGSMRHLVRTSKQGEITRWPLIEGSLTPTPANPLATVDFVEAKAHFKAIDSDIDLESLTQAISLAELAGLTADAAAALTAGTEDLWERRTKDGRQLSDSNREHVGQALDALKAATARLSTLLDRSDPAKAEADAQALRRLRMAVAVMRLRTIAL